MTSHITTTTGGTVTTPIPDGDLRDRHLVRLRHASAGLPVPSSMELPPTCLRRAVSA